jgi:hypothetical protein
MAIKQLAFQPTGTGFIHVTSGVEDGAAVAVASGGWQTALDFNFDAQSNVTFTSDTTFTFGGLTWTKRGSLFEVHAPSANADIVNGQGFRLRPGRDAGFSASDYGNIQATHVNSAPALALPFSAFMPANIGWPTSIEVGIEMFSESITGGIAEGDTFISIDDGGTANDGGVPFTPGYGAFGLDSSSHRTWYAGTRRMSSLSSEAQGAAQACTAYMFQVDALAVDQPQTLTSFVAAGGLPTDDAWIPTRSTTQSVVHSMRGQIPTSTGALWVVVGAFTASENTAYTSIVKRLRIRYRF